MDTPRANPSLEKLLRHSGWMRGLARSLVNESDVEDLVQDCWIAALQRDSYEAPTCPWIVRVLRNLARRKHRDESRRRRRESRVAKEEFYGQENVLVYAEMHRRLVEELLNLREPYRSTVLLRFFDELRPKDIAREHQITVSAVRTRLSRALQLLRARLDSTHDGGRQEWLASLAPLFRPGSKGKTAVIGGDAAAGKIASPAGSSLFQKAFFAAVASASAVALIASVAFGVWRFPVDSHSHRPMATHSPPATTAPGVEAGERRDKSVEPKNQSSLLCEETSMPERTVGKNSVLSHNPSPRQARIRRGERGPQFRLARLCPPLVVPVTQKDFGEAAHNVVREALSAGSDDEAARIHLAFLKDNLFAPESPVLASTLGCLYSRMGKVLDAKLWTTVAKELVGDHPLANTFEINLAHVEAQAGELDTAKKRLWRLMEMEVPSFLDDPYAIVPQLFVAPSQLAKIYEMEGRLDEADALLQSVTWHATALSREHPGVPWLPSYAVVAYAERFELARRSSISNVAKRAEEYLESIPDMFRQAVEERITFHASAQ